jgi:hypothetical protein
MKKFQYEAIGGILATMVLGSSDDGEYDDDEYDSDDLSYESTESLMLFKVL